MKKIAIIDDSQEILELLKECLYNFFTDINIVTFDSGDEFLKFKNISTFNLVITDFQMPGIQGDELAKIIKEHNKNIPIMLITANGNNELVRRLFVNNIVNDYIDKPIDIETLISRVSKLLNINNNFIWIRNQKNGESIKLFTNTILYIKTIKDKQKTLEFSTIKDTFIVTNVNLSDYIEMLPSNFIKISRSIIINKDNISGLNNKNFQIAFDEKTLILGKSIFYKIKKENFNLI